MAVVVVAIVAFAVFALSLVMLWSSQGERLDGAQAAADDAARRQALALMSVPEFTATAQDGRTLTRADLEGRWTVLSFGFTHCTLVCPIMHGQMHRLQEMLDKAGLGERVHILTISVDPANDTPERLAEYSGQMQADPARWTFARAEPDQLDRLMVEGLGLGMSTNPERQVDMGAGRMMDDIVHSSRALVIAPDLTVAAMYRGTDPAEIEQLYRDLKSWTNR